MVTHPDDSGARLRAAVNLGGDVAKLVLSGELDFITAPLLARLVNVAIDSGVRHIDIDLARLDFTDLAGVRALLRAQRDSTRLSVVLTLRHPQPHLVWLLETVGAGAALDDVPGPYGPRNTA